MKASDGKKSERLKIGYWVITVAIIGAIVSSSDVPEALVTIIAAISCFIAGSSFVTLHWKGSENEWITQELFYKSFLLRLLGVFVLFHLLSYDFGEPFVGGDDKVYENIGWNLAQDGWNSYVPDKDPAYYYLNAFLYSIFGHNILIVRLFNVLAGALTVVLVHAIFVKIFGDSVSKRGANYLVFFPDHIFYGSMQLRDTLVLLFIVAIVWQWLITLENRQFRFQQTLVLTVLCLMLGSLRFLLAGFVSILAVTHLVMKKRLIEALAIVSVIFILSGLPLLHSESSYLSEAPSLLIARMETYFEPDQSEKLQNRVGEESSFSVAQDSLALQVYSNPSWRNAEGLALLAVGYIAFWFLPFPPWMLITFENVSDNLIFIGTMYWYALLPFSLAGIYYSLRDNKNKYRSAFVPILVVLLISLGLVITGSVIGGTSRYRLMIMPFIFMFASLGFERRRSYWSLLRLLYISLFGLATTIYLYAKYFYKEYPPEMLLVCAVVVLTVVVFMRHPKLRKP